VYATADGHRAELIEGHQSRAGFEQDRYYHNVPLYPFVNRLDAGCYQHRGNTYRLALNEPSTGNSLHGFLFRRVPQVEKVVSDLHSAEVTLAWHYPGDDPGYPFAADIRQHWHLHTETGLTIEYSVRNLHHAPVPLAIGLHPYFRLGGKVDDWILQLPAGLRVLLDGRMLPTGELAPFTRFATPVLIGDVRFDDCLELVPTGEDEACTRLWSPTSRIGLELWQRLQDYPMQQVFIPPDRGSIAIEPVSGGINCFNTGTKLRLLGPGEVFSARNGVRIMDGFPQRG
jgi:aldose 1-epimerase